MKIQRITRQYLDKRKVKIQETRRKAQLEKQFEENLFDYDDPDYDLELE